MQHVDLYTSGVAENYREHAEAVQINSTSSQDGSSISSSSPSHGSLNKDTPHLSDKVRDLDKVKGMEVIAFDHAEVTQNRKGKNTFLYVGSLNVVYFPEYDRFILDLEDWEYALLKRLPVTCSSRTNMETRTYTFPCIDGFFAVKLTKIPHPEALQNFETILMNSTTFSYLGEEKPVQENERSPDMSLVETNEEEEIVSHPSTLRAESKNTKENFVPEIPEKIKLTTGEKLKRGFARFTDKFSADHAKKIATNNKFFTQIMEFSQMKDMKTKFAPKDTFKRKDVEQIIQRGKNIGYHIHFGTFPTTEQILKRESITETLDKEESARIPKIEEEIMTESIQLFPYMNDLVTEEERNVLEKINTERELQYEERRFQKEHRRKLSELIENERQLQDCLSAIQKEIRLHAVQKVEESYQVDIDAKDDLILKNAQTRNRELAQWELRERDLVAEIKSQLIRLREVKQMSEEELTQLAEHEKELLEKLARVEIARKEAELRTQEVLKEATEKNEILEQRDNEAKRRLDEIKREEERLEKETRERISELESKQKLTEKERQELLEKKEQMKKQSAMTKKELIEIAQQQQRLYEDSVRILADLKEREKMTEAERLRLEQREKEIEEEYEKQIFNLKAREFLTEEQRNEILEKERELKRIAVMREAERVEFVRLQLELQAAAQKKEEELIAKEQFTENEWRKLENMKTQLKQQHLMKEAELRDLIQKRDELYREVELREAEINRRLSLTEEEYEKLRREEDALEKEIQRELAELEIKEQLTEFERHELEKRKRELLKISETKELELKAKQAKLDKVKKLEQEIMKQNKELIEGQKELREDIKELEKELEKPVEVVTTTRTITKIEKKEELHGDVSQA